MCEKGGGVGEGGVGEVAFAPADTECPLFVCLFVCLLL